MQKGDTGPTARATQVPGVMWALPSQIPPLPRSLLFHWETGPSGRQTTFQNFLADLPSLSPLPLLAVGKPLGLLSWCPCSDSGREASPASVAPKPRLSSPRRKRGWLARRGAGGRRVRGWGRAALEGAWEPAASYFALWAALVMGRAGVSPQGRPGASLLQGAPQDADFLSGHPAFLTHTGYGVTPADLGVEQLPFF